MKRFGDNFEKYEVLKFSNVVERPVISINKSTSLETKRMATKTAYSLLSHSAENEKILKKAVGIAPVANVYEISSNQTGLSKDIIKNMANFNYFVVELGLNVCVGKEAKIPELSFNVELYSDSIKRTDVTTNSVAPNDQLKKVASVDGKITFGLSNLLELIPVVGAAASKLLKIDIGPIEFKKEISKQTIDTSGPRNYSVYWLLYETETVQSFNPTMVLKARKNVKQIWADVTVNCTVKTGLFSSEQKSDALKIDILPT